MNIFKDTMSEMTYGQIKKWCDGAAEDKTLIPHGYVGDPRGSWYIVTNLKEADRRIAEDIVNMLGMKYKQELKKWN